MDYPRRSRRVSPVPPATANLCDAERDILPGLPDLVTYRISHPEESRPVLDGPLLNEEPASPESTALSARRPRTLTVLGLIAAAALVFSYLGAYALADALVSAEVLQAWPRDSDPRPRWMLVGF